jgi:GT2 family glycosyltransferase
MADLQTSVDALGIEGDIYTVFWWNHIPLGHRLITHDNIPQLPEAWIRIGMKTALPALQAMYPGSHFSGSADDYAGMSLALTRLQAESLLPASSIENQDSLSVVICTRNRPAQLRICLDSILAQRQIPEEIVVVDNASSSTETENVARSYHEVRYIEEPRVGLDNARNAGLHAASSELIAYADDDVITHKNWVGAIKAGFAGSEPAALTGPVFPAELETLAQQLFERYWSFNRGYAVVEYGAAFMNHYQNLGAPTWEIGAGASMAFRRRVLQELGGFDERLDVGAAGCSGDSEMWYRILDAGYCCRYEPTMAAFHQHRREMKELRNQLFHYMRGNVTELCIRMERGGHRGNLVRIAYLPVYYFRVIVGALFRDRTRLLTIASEIGGVFSGFRYYFSHRKRPSRAS